MSVVRARPAAVYIRGTSGVYWAPGHPSRTRAWCAMAFLAPVSARRPRSPLSSSLRSAYNNLFLGERRPFAVARTDFK